MHCMLSVLFGTICVHSVMFSVFSWIDAVFIIYNWLEFTYWNCNFAMTPPVRWLVGWSVGMPVLISHKRARSYTSILLSEYLIFHWNKAVHLYSLQKIAEGILARYMLTFYPFQNLVKFDNSGVALLLPYFHGNPTADSTKILSFWFTGRNFIWKYAFKLVGGFGPCIE